MAKTKHSQNQDLQDEKMNKIAEKKSSKSANSENPASDKWEIPSDWEVSKLGNFLEKIVGGGTPSRENSQYWNGDINWATVKDFTNFNPFETQEKITELGLNNSASKLIPKGTIITVTRMALGKAVKFEIDVAINQDLKAIFPKPSLDVGFLYYWFEKNTSIIQGLGNGSTVKGITLEDLKSIQFYKIPLPEQIAIAQLLSTWDNAITKTQALIAQKEQRKKWLMQNLLTGKMRLKGFDGEWEDIELGELLNYEQPTKHLVKDTLYNNLYATPVLTAGKTFILGYTNEENGICTDLPVVIFDDFTTASKYVDFPFKAKSSAMKLLRPKSTANLKYVFEAMQQMQYAVGGHERHWISKFVYLTVPCPSLEEQTAIAKVLQAADKEIQLLKTKCGKLKEQKKGLMQVLLTGKKRLKIKLN
jgi:type I restriction enzyme S subunit